MTFFLNIIFEFKYSISNDIKLKNIYKENGIVNLLEDLKNLYNIYFTTRRPK